MKANTWIVMLLFFCIVIAVSSTVWADKEDDAEERAEIDAMAKETLTEQASMQTATGTGLRAIR